MPRRSFSSRRRPSTSRKKVWARRPFSGTVLSSSGEEVPARLDFLDIFTANLGAAPIGATVVRTRGIMSISSAGANTDLHHVRLTAYVGSQNEIARGPAGSDNTFSDFSQNKDHFIFEPFTVVGDGQEPDFSGSDPVSRLIDVKSSRKVEELNQTVIMDVSCFSPTTATAVALTFHGDFSMLLMLP